MLAWPKIARLSRSALAVAALYALVLGNFLGAIPGGPAAGSAHVLCSPSAGEGSSPAPLPVHKSDCCILACMAGAAPAAQPAAAASTPDRVSILIAWSVQAEAPAGRSAPRDTRVRGPPDRLT
jgi:hypothetical protein